MDTKRSLALLLAFYVKMQALLLCVEMPGRGTRDETTKVTIYVYINNLSSLTFGPVWTDTRSTISENLSKRVTMRERGAF